MSARIARSPSPPLYGGSSLPSASECEVSQCDVSQRDEGVIEENVARRKISTGVSCNCALTDDLRNPVLREYRNGPSISVDFVSEYSEEDNESTVGDSKRIRKTKDRIINNVKQFPQNIEIAPDRVPVLETPEAGFKSTQNVGCDSGHFNTDQNGIKEKANCATDKEMPRRNIEAPPVPTLPDEEGTAQAETIKSEDTRTNDSSENTSSSCMSATRGNRSTLFPRVGLSNTDIVINTSPFKDASGGTTFRKLSMPASPVTARLELPPTLWQGGKPMSHARRRLSNVSDAVSRKLSSTIGWRAAGGADEVVPQAKYLCSQYIRSRLKRAGLLSKKLGLQRLRSVANMQGGWEVCEVFPRVSCLGQEMERTHPKLYGSVVRQLSVSLKSDKVVRHLMRAISCHLLNTHASWPRIISLYAVAAALAADCVKQGHPEYVSSVIEGVGLAIEEHSCTWIVSQGGWSGVLVWSQPPAFEFSPMEIVLLVGGAGVLLAALIGGVFTLLGHLMESW